MSTRHWVLIGGFIVATGSVIQGLDHFADLWENPGIAGGLIVQMGTNILAVFTDKPKRGR